MREYQHSRRIRIPPEVRQFIFERDQYRCQRCGHDYPMPQLQVDHIVPVAKGGTHDLSNLQTLCQSCNRQKRDRIDPRFRHHY